MDQIHMYAIKMSTKVSSKYLNRPFDDAMHIGDDDIWGDDLNNAYLFNNDSDAHQVLVILEEQQNIPESYRYLRSIPILEVVEVIIDN